MLIFFCEKIIKKREKEKFWFWRNVATFGLLPKVCHDFAAVWKKYFRKNMLNLPCNDTFSYLQIFLILRIITKNLNFKNK